MYTNPHIYRSSELVEAKYLNRDTRDNINAIYSLATNTESLLNPLIAGTIGYSQPFDLAAVSLFGFGTKIGIVGLERTMDQNLEAKREWRVAVSYSMATNSLSGSVLNLYKSPIAQMGRAWSDELPPSDQIFAGPTITDPGQYFHVSPWYSMASMYDEVWAITVFGETEDSPDAGFSSLNVCFQVRDY